MIAANPWAGTGFGEFNLVWSIAPFVNRPTAFSDHTHNLPLQLMLELGLSLALLVLALLVAALWQAWPGELDAVMAEINALDARHPVQALVSGQVMPLA